MANRVTTVLLLSALSFIPIACGDGGTGPNDDALSQVEITALMAGLESLGNLDAAGTSAEALEEGATLATLPCPLGGDVTVSGSVLDTGGENTFVLEYDVTMTHRACQVPGNGLNFTIDGRPNLRQTGTLTIVGFFEALSLDAQLTGTLDWALDDRSGSCVVNISMTAEASEAGSTGSASGTVCGITYSQDLSVI